MPPPPIASGALRAFFAYDIADTIDLARLRSISGEGVARAPLQLRNAASPAIQFPDPPLVVRLGETPLVPGASVRARIFDYGVVVIRIDVPFAGEWDAFTEASRAYRRNPALVTVAANALERIRGEIVAALDDPHDALVEDYFIFEVDRFAAPLSAADLVGRFGPETARLLMGENEPLSPLETAESLRQTFSYFADDLVVVQWDTAFVYDRPDGAAATADILEFANTQLAELRTYDARLDAELDRIYRLEVGSEGRFRRRAQERAADLRYTLVDVLELTDRASNALKLTGDAYYARLYRGIAARLGLADWQRQLDAKLASVGEVYRFYQDQAQTRRGEVLELVVIALIALELVIGVLELLRLSR